MENQMIKKERERIFYLAGCGTRDQKDASYNYPSQYHNILKAPSQLRIADKTRSFSGTSFSKRNSISVDA